MSAASHGTMNGMFLSVVLLVSLASSTLLATTGPKKSIRKCCGVSEEMVETGPGQRQCRGKENIGHMDQTLNNNILWKKIVLSEFVMYHGEPECQGGEHLTPVYDHKDGTDLLTLQTNGSLTHSGKHVEVGWVPD